MSESYSEIIKHEVFLNFRGTDTRESFISHLYAELKRKNVETYIDYKLARGEEISPALERAIEESLIYVLVFSEHYASSTWCLRELEKILECKDKYGRHVIPVFYKVDPSTVRHQRERYKEAFLKHELRFKDKVQPWKNSLTIAAGISGWDSNITRPEYTLVSNIVEDILTKLNRSPISDHKGVVGIEKHIERIESLLHLESPATRIIGVWGMPGIGKSTIASQIHHKFMAWNFDSSRLVLHAQKQIERDGLAHIREFSNFSSETIRGTKVLLILDDVNNSDHLNYLIAMHGRAGSRIIVTSKDMQVLKNAEADAIYEVEKMNFQDSLKLFSLHAFKQNHPLEAYMDLSIKVLNYAKGIPLALKVLGSLLYDRKREVWESELKKLENHLDHEIFNVLKLSYEGLDEEQKDIFLDITCFYRGFEEIVVAQMLDCCGFSAVIGMEVLKDRGLISVLEDKVEMHDVIQEMGQEIVLKESVNSPGKRSRLWKVKDIENVLTKNKGTDAIQCIFLDICKIKEVRIHSKSFDEMDNLRMLQFYNNQLFSGYCNQSNLLLPSFLESLPDGLKILHWDAFPQKSLPQNFCPENLVRLVMRHSHLEQLWEPDQNLRNLKRLDLSYSRKLIGIPDLYLSPDIEEVILSNCESLIQVYSSGFLSKLNCLCLNDCALLRSLTIPSNILWRSSGVIILSKCSNLETFSTDDRTQVVELRGFTQRDRFPTGKGSSYLVQQRLEKPHTVTFDPVKNIVKEGGGEAKKRDLHILYKLLKEGKSLSSLFSSPNDHWCWLDLSFCESLKSIPFENDLSKLKFMKRLILNHCLNLEYFPEIENTMENLTVLKLDYTAIRALPSTLCRLVSLEKLSLRYCVNLKIIPSSIGNLNKLCKLNIIGCKSLETFPSSIFKLKLMRLDLFGFSMLRTFPEILEPAETFAHINLTEAAIKELPSSIGDLVWLLTLNLEYCTSLESLPNNIVNLTLLSVLDCSGCAKLTKFPREIGRLSLLRELSLSESIIVNLPESIAHLSSLKLLDLSNCRNLECIPQLPPFLEQLVAFDCQSIRRVMSNLHIQVPSNSKEGVFRFYFTNAQQLHPDSHANLVDDAWHRMTKDAFRTVFFCFPGSAVPHWFPFRGEGHSVTINKDSLNFCSNDRLIGFALCVVLQVPDTYEYDIEGRYSSYTYSLNFESGDGTHTLPNNDELRNHFYWKSKKRIINQDHIFMWKYNLGLSSKSLMLCDARSFTFEINSPYDEADLWQPRCLISFFRQTKTTVTLKECGICPLYTKDR